MNFRESPEQNIPGTYEDLVQLEIDNGQDISQKEAIENVERTLFKERVSQFTESDLKEDKGGGWEEFEQKVRDVFPEFPEDRFSAIKAAVTKHLCGL